MSQYLSTLRQVKDHGRRRDGTVPKVSIFSHEMKFHLDDGFPILNEEPGFFESVCREYLWLARGECDAESLELNEEESGLSNASLKKWKDASLPEDLTRVVQKTLFEMAGEYHNIRSASNPELSFQEVILELNQADREAVEEGKPPLEDIARGNFSQMKDDELFGGLKLMRDAGIVFTKEQIILPKGYLGPVCGVLWRKWISHDGRVIDQLSSVIGKLLSDNPNDRFSCHHIVSGFNPAVAPNENADDETNILAGKQPLSVNHHFFQLYVETMSLEERLQHFNKQQDERQKHSQTSVTEESLHHARLQLDALFSLSGTSKRKEDFTIEDGHTVLDQYEVPRERLSMKVNQHSVDVFSELPHFVAGYALLLSIIAEQVKMKVNELIVSLGEVYLRVDHLEAAQGLLTKDSRVSDESGAYVLKLPSPMKSFDEIVASEISLAI